ncbi:MAG: hypothetical protein ABIV11_06020 [Gemmatimonadaceae bacterium]
MQFPKYTTTVVGSYSVPRFYEVIELQIEAGVLLPEDMEMAQFHATQAAIMDQQVAGIDIITGGEMHRSHHVRRSRARRRVQQCLGLRAAAREDHDDRSAHAGEGRLR